LIFASRERVSAQSLGRHLVGHRKLLLKETHGTKIWDEVQTNTSAAKIRA